MPACAIRDERRPGSVQRPVIADLAARSVAYIIVSAQGSVADKPQSDRRDAIRGQLDDLAEGAKLRSDLFEGDQLTT
jgi:hypothetical protein